MEILDSGGQVIRREEIESHAGLNRASWDLRYERPHTVVLRTLPPDNPHIWEDTRFRGKDTRPILALGHRERAVGRADRRAGSTRSV